jgi:hypothetical protein
MSSWFDLKPRLEAGIGAEESLHVESVYRNCPLPGWLQKPMDSCAANAGERTAVLVLNVKGKRTDDVLCMLTLSCLERLLRRN